LNLAARFIFIGIFPSHSICLRSVDRKCAVHFDRFVSDGKFRDYDPLNGKIDDTHWTDRGRLWRNEVCTGKFSLNLAVSSFIIFSNLTHDILFTLFLQRHGPGLPSLARYTVCMRRKFILLLKLFKSKPACNENSLSLKTSFTGLSI
jgi:hypothetical protein